MIPSSATYTSGLNVSWQQKQLSKRLAKGSSLPALQPRKKPSHSAKPSYVPEAKLATPSSFRVETVLTLGAAANDCSSQGQCKKQVTPTKTLEVTQVDVTPDVPMNGVVEAVVMENGIASSLNSSVSSSSDSNLKCNNLEESKGHNELELIISEDSIKINKMSKAFPRNNP